MVDVLRRKPSEAHLDRPHDERVVAMTGEDDDLHRRVVLLEHLRRFEPRARRQRVIHQHHVGDELVREGPGLGHVTGDADDVEPGLGGHGGPEALGHHLVVVDDHHSNGCSVVHQ